MAYILQEKGSHWDDDNFLPGCVDYHSRKRLEAQEAISREAEQAQGWTTFGEGLLDASAAPERPA